MKVSFGVVVALMGCTSPQAFQPQQQRQAPFLQTQQHQLQQRRQQRQFSKESGCYSGCVLLRAAGDDLDRLAREWANMNRGSDAAAPAPSPVPTSSMEDLAKQWASTNRDRESTPITPPPASSSPLPPPVWAPAAPPQQTINPMEDLAKQWAATNQENKPPQSIAPVLSMDDLAKQWTATNREQESPSPLTSPPPAAAPEAPKPPPQAPTPVFSMDDLAKQWAAANREQDSITPPPAPSVVSAPWQPPAPVVPQTSPQTSWSFAQQPMTGPPAPVSEPPPVTPWSPPKQAAPAPVTATGSSSPPSGRSLRDFAELAKQFEVASVPSKIVQPVSWSPPQPTEPADAQPQLSIEEIAKQWRESNPLDEKEENDVQQVEATVISDEETQKPPPPTVNTFLFRTQKLTEDNGPRQRAEEVMPSANSGGDVDGVEAMDQEAGGNKKLVAAAQTAAIGTTSRVVRLMNVNDGAVVDGKPRWKKMNDIMAQTLTVPGHTGAGGGSDEENLELKLALTGEVPKTNTDETATPEKRKTAFTRRVLSDPNGSLYLGTEKKRPKD